MALRLDTTNTHTIRAVAGQVTTFRPIIGQGPQGLPGPGSAAWTALEAVTTGAVRQAPDGSWIKSTGNRTTRASFDATEQGFWTAVLGTDGTVEALALAASNVERTRTWHAAEHGVPFDGTTAADAALDALLALMDPGDILSLPPDGTMKLASRHDLDQRIIIEGNGCTITQATTAGAFRLVAGSAGSSIRNLTGVGPDGTTYAANSVFIRAEGSVGTYLEDITIENVTGRDWGNGTLECKFVRRVVTSDVLTEDCMYIGQSFLSCEDITLFNPMCDTLQGLSGNSNCYAVIFSRDSSLSIANAPRTKNATIHGGWARNIPWEGVDTHGGEDIRVNSFWTENVAMSVAFTVCPNESAVPTYAPLNCWAYNCTAKSGVTDGTSRDAFMLVGATSVEKATGGFVACTAIGHGDQDLASAASGGFFLQETLGAQIIGARALECSPHGVVLYVGNVETHIDGLDVVDPWSNSYTAPSAVRVDTTGQSVTMAGVVLRDGTKSATYVGVGGINNPSGCTVRDGGGNDLTAAGFPVANDATSHHSKFFAPIEAPNGSASKPSHSFANSLGLGFYRTADNQMSLAANGIQQLNFIDGAVIVSKANWSWSCANGLQFGGASSHKLGFFGATPIARPSAFTQTYSTADKTLAAYTPDVENSAYTGAADGEARLVDVNALRVAYENLRAFVEDLAQHHNALLDDLQALGIIG